MISFLSGKIHSKSENSITLDVNGVGYEVFVAKNVALILGESGSPLKLEIHTNMTENSLQLFGFRSTAEKAVFLKLISVSGIGPKSALNILSDVTIADLQNAIASGNVTALTKVNGIGKKTAERLVVELKDKFSENPVTTKQAANDLPVQDSRLSDVINALISLGYADYQARRIVKDLLPSETDSVQTLIKKSLAMMS